MTRGTIGWTARTYRHARRYRQILGTLIKYGFGELVERLGVSRRVEAGLRILGRKKKDVEVERVDAPCRLRMMFEELGPTFVKLGQVLSTRPDLLPAEYLDELRKLQQEVTPVSFDEVRRIVENDLGRPLGRLYAEFEEEPAAAASIGQVHRAVLPDGAEVVVKVRRPGIERIVHTDLEILTRLATAAEQRIGDWGGQSPRQTVDEIRRVIERELDFSVEATHLAHMARLLEGDDRVRLPATYPDLNSRRVLTMEKLDVVPVTDRGVLREHGFDPAVIARRITELLLEQILVHGFFHADPHPGNVFALGDNVVCLLDLGMVGRLGRRDRETFADLVYAVGQRDTSGAATALLELAEPVDGGAANLRRLETDLGDFIDLHMPGTIDDLELGPFVQDLLGLVRRHGLRMPPDLVTMLKTIGTLEQIVCSLDPELDVVALIVARARKLRLARVASTRLLRDVAAYAGDLTRFARDVPYALRDILGMARLGKFKIGLEHRRLEKVLETHERVSNRVSFAIVVAALIVGSSMIVHSELPPTIGEIPVIGLIGFLLAGALGLLLLFSILRRGRL
jgi:ubiquinone biosynthesis protein